MRPARYNRGMSLLVAALILAQAPAAAAPDPPPQELAQALQRKIVDFEARHKAGKPPASKSVVVADDELSAYLNLLVKLPPSLTAVEVRFERERIAAKGLLDLDQLQDQLGGASLGSLFGGRVQVALKGKLTSDDGFGSFAIEEARLGSIPLSPSVLAQMVASATRSADRPAGFDVLAPFRYPYGVKSIRLSPGRAVLEF